METQEKTIGHCGRTKSQLKAASVRASEARSKRAEAKRQVMEGELSILQLLTTSDKDLLRIKVFDLVSWVNRVGKIRAKRTMHELRIAEDTRIAGLGDLQKIRLYDYISKGAWG